VKKIKYDFLVEKEKFIRNSFLKNFKKTMSKVKNSYRNRRNVKK